MNSSTLNAMFSSKTDDHATPQEFFDELNKEFGFQLDVCASADNAKTPHYYTREQDGLTRNWADVAARVGGAVWMNPPYGREIGKWMAKAYAESRNGATVVCLVPARTDTRWWHDYVLNKAEVRFVKGRLKFGGSKNAAPFPSAVVIYRPDGRGGSNV